MDTIFAVMYFYANAHWYTHTHTLTHTDVHLHTHEYRHTQMHMSIFCSFIQITTSMKCWFGKKTITIATAV